MTDTPAKATDTPAKAPDAPEAPVFDLSSFTVTDAPVIERKSGRTPEPSVLLPHVTASHVAFLAKDLKHVAKAVTVPDAAVPAVRAALRSAKLELGVGLAVREAPAVDSDGKSVKGVTTVTFQVGDKRTYTRKPKSDTEEGPEAATEDTPETPQTPDAPAPVAKSPSPGPRRIKAPA